MEYKNYKIEFKDIDTKKGEILVKHATFNGIDRVDDTIEETAFSEQYKSVNPKDIGFYFNHYSDQIIGETKKVFTDKEAAYTLAQFGKDALGQALMEMSVNRALAGVSMGYIAERKEYTYKGSKRVRKLKKINHRETSLLTKTPADPKAGIVDVKSFVTDRAELIKNIESFCRNSKKAPDSLLRQLEVEVKEMKADLDNYTYNDWLDEVEALERKIDATRQDHERFMKQFYLNRIKNSL
jgi:HK97 family phage prohead protease